MRPNRHLVLALVLLLAAVVIQTTVFGRFRLVTPDLVAMVSILFTLTPLRREAVLMLAFTGGLVIDLLGSTVVGLRAAVLTLVAYLALRTVDRVDLGPVVVALWTGLLTLVGVVLFIVVGSLFGQTALVGTEVGRRIVLVPIANTVFSLLIGPLVVRLMSPDRNRGGL